MSGSNGSHRQRAEERRAIIDIGSNTIRIVIYGGPPRAPHVLHNEKVTARLGRDLSRTGKIPAEASELALAALRRFARLVEELHLTDIDTVATAAVRDASNGEEFLEKVRELGFVPRLLSGEEEAETSADGVIAAFPGARGIVADLGGGSLELVEVTDGSASHGASLPLGTLRLPAVGEKLNKVEAIREVIDDAGWNAKQGQNLYLVGGTLRAFGRLVMVEAKSPLEDPHGYEIDCDEALASARRIADTKTKQLDAPDDVSNSRVDMLPDAAALLCALIEKYRPHRLILSAWGLREGLLFRRASPDVRLREPLLAGVSAFSAARGVSPQMASIVAGWIAGIPGSRGERIERLRLTTAMLTLTNQRLEPNLRQRHGYDWALRKRWLDIRPAERAMLAAAMLAQTGETSWPDELERLATPEELAEGRAWGLAIRLVRRLGSASLDSLVGTALRFDDTHVTLAISDETEPLYGPGTEKDLSRLASALDLEPRVEKLRRGG